MDPSSVSIKSKKRERDRQGKGLRDEAEARQVASSMSMPVCAKRPGTGRERGCAVPLPAKSRDTKLHRAHIPCYLAQETTTFHQIHPCPDP